MNVNKNAQHLLVQLWTSVEDKEKPDFVPSGAQHDTVNELVHLGLLEQNGQEMALTATGRAEATHLVRRQRLAERLLADVVTTEGMQTGEHACGLEGTLWEEQENCICTLLGHPQFCPHGKPIPPGACCRQKRTTAHRLMASLSELEPGQRGYVAYVHTHHPQYLPKLMAMGVLPGVTITLLRRSPSFVFEAGYSQFAVDAEMAAEIYVRLVETDDTVI